MIAFTGVNSPKVNTVYVSISRKSNKEHIRKVLKYLSGLNIRVATFVTGTKYEIEDLDEMDAMIVILPEDPRAADHDFGMKRYTIGKGQYVEIEYMMDNVTDNAVYVVVDTEDGLYLDEVR